MPKLNQMPTRAEFGMVFSGLPGMIRIGELIDEWHISGWFTQITIAFLIERASKFIIKNTVKHWYPEPVPYAKGRRATYWQTV